MATRQDDGLTARFDDFVSRYTADHERIQATLDRIHQQTTATNGRLMDTEKWRASHEEYTRLKAAQFESMHDDIDVLKKWKDGRDGFNRAWGAQVAIASAIIVALIQAILGKYIK